MKRALGLVVIVSVLTSACATGDQARALWREDFETECNGSACGWTQIAGPAGAATWIETVPSEHGISMVGSGIAVSRPIDGRELMGGGDTVRSLRAHVVARCDTGSELTLILTVTSGTTGAAVDVSGSATFPSMWDGSRSMFALSDGSADPTEVFTDITNIVLHKSGTGACEVDYISLADSMIGFAE